MDRLTTLFDAAADPTGTASIRKAFRAEGERRVATLLKIVRIALIDQDMMAINTQFNGFSFFPRKATQGEAQLASFVEWFTSTIYVHLVDEGKWLREHLEKAYDSGVTAAAKLMKIEKNHIVDMETMLHQAARRELEGIADATIQQVGRAVANGLRAKAKPARISNEVRVIFEKVTIRRIQQLAHTFTVRLHNEGRLDQFSLAGVKSFGLIPETKIKRRKVRDHIHDAEEDDDRPERLQGLGEMVNLLTAGDEKVCEECEELADGGPYDIDEAQAISL